MHAINATLNALMAHRLRITPQGAVISSLDFAKSAGYEFPISGDDLAVTRTPRKYLDRKETK